MGERPGWELVVVAVAAVLEVGLTLALSGSDIHTGWKIGILVLIPVLIAIVVVLRRRRAQRRSERAQAETPAPRRLKDLYKVKGHIAPGWFVSFTAGPYPTAADRRGQYATAIAEVIEFEGDIARLKWRDRVVLPVEIPVALLDANQVIRLREGKRVRCGNEGLVVVGKGGVTSSPGWHAHQSSPFRAAFTRVAHLEDDDRRRFEAEGDLGTYVLDELG